MFCLKITAVQRHMYLHSPKTTFEAACINFKPQDMHWVYLSFSLSQAFGTDSRKTWRKPSEICTAFCTKGSYSELKQLGKSGLSISYLAVSDVLQNSVFQCVAVKV